MNNTAENFNPSVWLPPMPEKELYDVYHQTLQSRFGVFGTRPFDDTIGDLAMPLLTHQKDEVIDDNLLHIIVQPKSFEHLQNSLDEHAQQHGIEGWLDHEGSVVYVTNHGQFTDVPVVAEAIGRIKLGERERTVQIVSKMISLMTLDIGDGPFVVIDKLRAIANAVQTVPRIEGNPTKELRDYRKESNLLGDVALKHALRTKGSIGVESLIGRHDIISHSGKTLYLHEPNIRTAEQLSNPHTKVVPLFIDCPTFGSDGSINPADIQFEIFEPMHIENPKKDSRLITELFRDATKRNLADGKRVHIRSWTRQQGKASFKKLRSAVLREGATDSDY